MIPYFGKLYARNGDPAYYPCEPFAVEVLTQTTIMAAALPEYVGVHQAPVAPAPIPTSQTVLYRLFNGMCLH